MSKPIDTNEAREYAMDNIASPVVRGEVLALCDALDAERKWRAEAEAEHKGEVARLRAALEPFARMVGPITDRTGMLAAELLADCRDAAVALAGGDRG